MMKRAILLFIVATALALSAGAVNIDAINRPAEKVFAEIARQTGKNFVYDAELLRGMTVSITARDERLESVLRRMFAGKGIAFEIKGKNITLRRGTTTPAPATSAQTRRVTISGFVREAGSGETVIGAVVSDSISRITTATNDAGFFSLTVPAGRVSISVLYPGFTPYRQSYTNVSSNRDLNITMHPSEVLQEVTVIGDRNDMLALDHAQPGALNMTREHIINTPVLFGESDVIKALQLEPGVTAGIEGTAGLNVHGGDNDQNMYMLDNVPLYQVNHFAGLFSAFNTAAIKNVDFYKSAFPTAMDGRLSSYMDVHTIDGSLEEHHGSFTLGLTSGAFDINGPIVKGKTSYSFALRRSWFDILSIPALAIANTTNDTDHTIAGYAFSDINAKITHHFSDRSRAYVMFYYGEDYLRAGSESGFKEPTDNTIDDWYSKDVGKLRWGNIVASAGWTHVLNSNIFGSLTAAYTRYFSSVGSESREIVRPRGMDISDSFTKTRSANSIDNWIAKYTVDWRPTETSTIGAGIGATLHNFLPSREEWTMGATNGPQTTVRDTTGNYRAGQYMAYVDYNFTPTDRWRFNAGIHYTLFNIDHKTHHGISPRVAVRYTPAERWAVKASYSRACQPVYQLSQSLISLPTDRWLPITASDPMPTADNVAFALVYKHNAGYTFSVEAYYKWLHNLIDYRDGYYLLPPTQDWTQSLDHGKGRSKGFDFKVAKTLGNVTGHVAYSLMWADRQFDNRNFGRSYPARFDNRHKINILANWRINDRWELNAAWTGMSGNMITLSTQNWLEPDDIFDWSTDNVLNTGINNYRLPFYHRLDLSVVRHTKRGHWSISLFNTYCNWNVIAAVRDTNFVYGGTPMYDSNGNINISNTTVPVFKSISLIPIIPSFSYTWIF
ncbi:MAG: TonB-dependent receptor [Muribaculaceae bacterium]|nr:TonB-dependent receptor [Muribaculaceae bacterium]